jgi:hypothetical protein
VYDTNRFVLVHVRSSMLMAVCLATCAGTEAAQQQRGECLVQEAAGGGGEGAGDHRLARSTDAADPMTVCE